MIPTLLHQVWCGSPGPEEPPAKVYRPEWAESWRTHHPAWTYKRWEDDALLVLASKHHLALSTLRACAKYPVVRADIGRYLVLWVHGGLYADLDYECFRPFDELLSGGEAFVGEIGMRWGERSSGRLGNALLAFAPGHELARTLLGEACSRWLGGSRHVARSTGPAMLTEVAQRFSGVRILPSSLVMPTPVMMREDPKARANGAYATSYHAGWWRPGGTSAGA